MNAKTIKRNDMAMGIIIGIVSIIMIWCIQYTQLCFDASMNFQISENLSQTGEYKSNYIDEGYNGTQSTMFDHKIQTGSTVIIPAMILNKLFGVRASNMTLITIGYLILFMILLWVIQKKSNYLIVGFSIVAVISRVVTYAYDGYGEFVIAFFMVLSFYAFELARREQKKSLFYLTGILLGLGYLTKTVFLICGIVYFIYLCWDLFKTRKLNVLGTYCLLALGMFTPIVIFESYKLISLGASEYLLWWQHEFNLILGEAGVTDSLGTEASGLAKIIENVKAYLECFRINIAEFLMLYLIPTAYFIYKKVKKEAISLPLLGMYMVSLTYLIWWATMLPVIRLWERRDIIGHAFIMIVAFAILGKVLSQLAKRKKYICFVEILFVFYLGVCIVNNLGNVHQYLADSAYAKEKYNEFVLKVNELPEEAELYGYGWWQNPTIALGTNKEMKNLAEAEKITDESYFIEDVNTKKLSEDTLTLVKSEFYCEEIESINDNTLYKLYVDRNNTIKQKEKIWVSMSLDGEYVGYIDIYPEGVDKGAVSVYVKHGQEYVLLPLEVLDSDKMIIKFRSERDCTFGIRTVDIGSYGMTQISWYITENNLDKYTFSNMQFVRAEEGMTWWQIKKGDIGCAEFTIINEEMPDTYRLQFGNEYKLNAKDVISESVVRSGIALAEEDIAWTNGVNSELQVYMEPQKQDCTLTMQLIPYVCKEVAEQSVKVYVNNELLAEWLLNTDGEYTIQIPAKLLLQGSCNIRFNIDTAVSPKELGTGEDARQLGIAIGWIKFD